MKALDRKLLRDLLRMWSQALTIALVVASGVGGFITSLSAVDSLALARDRFYADGRFADVFASVKRAPDALVDAVHLVGPKAKIRDRLQAWKEAGRKGWVNTMQIQTAQPEALELLAQELL